MGGELTAIVCDDAPGFRALMVALLRERGVRVVGQAESWEEAERLAPGADVILADLWMPEPDRDALVRVRRAAPRAVLAIVSALSPEEAAGRVRDLGVDVVLPKTMNPGELVAQVLERAADRARRFRRSDEPG